MGKATRWLRALFGGRKPPLAEDRKPPKEKKRWGLVKSMREHDRAPAVPAERKGSYREVSTAAEAEGESKRAIAVAAATAAVAEAAVAAAQAAAAVVRLTSSGRAAVGVAPAGFGGLRKEGVAAIKIQAAFRGYLARRALRALKGLVKLQALVRGNIVRKQAAETFRCMQALVRVQARARACRALSAEKAAPPTPEKFESPIQQSSQKIHKAESHMVKGSSGWNWLDRWMDERYQETSPAARVVDDDQSTKILEVDMGKQRHGGGGIKLRSSSDQNSRSRSFTTVPGSPSSVDMPYSEAAEFDESPQFYSATSRPGSSRRGPFTPAKSDCSRSLFSEYSGYPSYMANTESSRAKARSQSAPKQRVEFERAGAAAAKRSSASALHAKFANKAYPGSGRLDRLGMPARF